jgi:hypothetical protein
VGALLKGEGREGVGGAPSANSMHPKIRSILALTRAIYVHERANRRYPCLFELSGVIAC